MQIDILSSNTLKLTLSRLDMFDLDIKYESLSGKNPETKRLLAHVLKTIRLDQKAGVGAGAVSGFDLSCERIFVEAFPRPDGGCMLYISSLEAGGASGKKKSQKAVKEEIFVTPVKIQKREKELHGNALIFETDSFSELGGVCRSLCRQKEWERASFDSALFQADSAQGGSYRLVIKSQTAGQSLLAGIIREYGDVLRGERELMRTREHFKPLMETGAAEMVAGLV
jgi:hypothetical protein